MYKNIKLYFRGEPRPEVFPIGLNAGKIQEIPKGEEMIARCLDANQHKGVTPEHYFEKSQRNIVFQQHSKDEIRKFDDSPTPCKRMCTGGNNVPMVHSTYRHAFEGFKGLKDISVPIKSSQGSGNQIIINGLRRLTPIECERLQGFPDNWTAEGINDNGEVVKISDTQRYKMCGNAVTTNVIEAIVESWIANITRKV